MLGQSLGNYTIERELGRGGMGAVYAAVHGLLGRRAAVKVLLPELSRNQDIVQRFFNEARAATAINHPSIVEIYDFGWAPDGSAYIVMELMDGESLSSRLRGLGRLPSANAITIARQIANALAAAHKAGIVHRDLKPDNVFLVPDIEVAGGERVKLLDFGIAKLAADGAVSRTTTGAIMGTPLYMSPEQCEGARQVDHRTDLYALGCILFEMIAGRVPFVHEGVGGLIGMHLYVAPPALRSLAPDAPAEVEAIVARLLAKKPEERFQTADELAAALSRAGAASSVPPTPIGLAQTIPSTLPSTPPPSTTLSAAASARMAAREGTPPPGSRRGSIAAIAGVVVVAAVVVIVVVASGGKTSSSRVAVDAAAVAALPDAAPALAISDAASVELPASSTAQAVERLRAALEQHQWADARRELDLVYDATTDGHPDRAQADDLIAYARPHIIEEATREIQTLAKKGECKDARQKAADTVETWGDEASVLVELAAKCRAPSTSPPPPPPRPPPPPEPQPVPEPTVGLTREVIQRVMSRLRPRVARCAEQHQMTGTMVVRIQIEPDGRVGQATIVRGGDGGDGDVCVIETMSRLEFPTSSSRTTFNYPFALGSASKD